MEKRMTYCPACKHDVEITVTPAPLHGGQATIPDQEVVCLDFGPGCRGRSCATFGEPRIVMGVRLARSGLRHDRMAHVQAMCEGCGGVSELDVVDETHAVCTLCGTVNTYTLLRLDGEEWVAVTGEKAKAELA